MEYYNEPNLEVGRVTRRGYELFKPNWLTLSAYKAFLSLVSIIEEAASVGVVTQLCISLVTTYPECGYNNILRKIAAGLDYRPEEYFKPNAKAWLKMVVVKFLWMLIFISSLLLLGLPLLYFGVRLLFVSMLAANHPEFSIADSFRRSWQMTEGHFSELFVLGVVAFGIRLLGACCLIVGYFPAAAITDVMQAELYMTLGGDSDIN